MTKTYKAKAVHFDGSRALYNPDFTDPAVRAKFVGMADETFAANLGEGGRFDVVPELSPAIVYDAGPFYIDWWSGTPLRKNEMG